jgi:hypothetical protein
VSSTCESNSNPSDDSLKGRAARAFPAIRGLKWPGHCPKNCRAAQAILDRAEVPCLPLSMGFVAVVVLLSFQCLCAQYDGIGFLRLFSLYIIFPCFPSKLYSQSCEEACDMQADQAAQCYVLVILEIMAYLTSGKCCSPSLQDCVTVRLGLRQDTLTPVVLVGWYDKPSNTWSNITTVSNVMPPDA